MSAARGFYGGLALGAGSVFAVHVTGTALGYVGQILLARWLGVAEYGSFAYIHAWSLLLANVAGLGLAPAALRFLPAYSARGEGRLYHSYLNRARLWTLGTALFLAVVIYSLAGAGKLGRYSEVWRVGAWLVPGFAFLNLHMQQGRAQGRVILAMAPQNLYKHALLLLGAGTLLLAGRELDAGSVLAAFAVGLSSMAIVQGLMLQGSHPDLPPGEVVAVPSGEWFRVAGPLLMILVFMTLITQTDVLLVGSLLGKEAVGVYNAASKSAATVGFAFFAVNAVGAPAIAALHAAGDRAGLRRMIRRTCRWVFWPALAIAMGLAVVGRLLLGFFGPAFTASYDEMLILSTGYLCAASMGLSPSLLNLTGNERVSALIYAGAAGLNLVLNLLLIPVLGTRGAALSTVAAMVAWNLAFFVVARRRLGVNPFILGWLGGKERSESA